jgi:hypothetical protein
MGAQNATSMLAREAHATFPQAFRRPARLVDRCVYNYQREKQNCGAGFTCDSIVAFHKGTVRVFRQKFTLEDAIEFHAFAPLEALPCVTNDIPLGCSPFLTSSHCKLRPNTEGHKEDAQGIHEDPTMCAKPKAHSGLVYDLVLSHQNLEESNAGIGHD